MLNTDWEKFCTYQQVRSKRILSTESISVALLKAQVEQLKPQNCQNSMKLFYVHLITKKGTPWINRRETEKLAETNSSVTDGIAVYNGHSKETCHIQ